MSRAAVELEAPFAESCHRLRERCGPMRKLFENTSRGVIGERSTKVRAARSSAEFSKVLHKQAQQTMSIAYAPAPSKTGRERRRQRGPRREGSREATTYSGRDEQDAHHVCEAVQSDGERRGSAPRRRGRMGLIAPRSAVLPGARRVGRGGAGAMRESREGSPGTCRGCKIFRRTSQGGRTARTKETEP